SSMPERWRDVLKYFDMYKTSSLPDRKIAREYFIKVLKLEHAGSKNLSKETTGTCPDPFLDVTYVKGVGPRIAAMLNKLGIFTAGDLLFYFPRKHIDYSKRTLIKHLELNQTTTVFGYIKSVESFITPKGLGVMKVRVADETGSILLNFFYAKSSKYILERSKRQFPVEAGIIVSGTVKINSYDGKYTLDNISYSIMSEDFLTKTNLNIARIVPVYSLSENLNIKTLRKAIYNVLQMYKNTIVNVVPDYLCEKYNLLDKKEAVEQIHFPDSMELLERARFSLVFEELFLVQLRLVRIREQNRTENKSLPLKVKQDGLVMNFINGLPFELTGAQKRAVNEILNDLNSTEPMQRLLQGDVGSGKTVVACIMLLAAVENGYQAAIMAPTEILAQQHYNNLVKWLTPQGLSVGLFTGSIGKKQRTEFENGLRNGQINVAVGTHALIQDSVEFANLGAVVIDEQHRFGVRQRLNLRLKAQNPQILNMTATPIPRTLAVTLNGDLDLTVIDELPRGRKPVITMLNPPKKEIYKLIRKEVKAGHQAYIVYPLIDESETLSAKAATKEAERLQQSEFSDLRIGLLHGKLKNSEKDDVMEKFKNKEYDILVSTTVVEVGVDVPNATVIVIENSERFGLSQLHQLRGRVGRCDLQSYCMLSSSNSSQEVKDRLSVMTETNDGFVIAEKDLQIRGPGEFLGIRQSGLPDLMISDIVRDAKILELARSSAIDFVKNNKIEDFPLLKDTTNLTLDGTLLLGA
ncbi:MAG: ATP-dependent DNA helicase RecG, partial [Candidatus Gastranaerophilales bacterium]|nr:ATP-dependent DNA helicase RecG [Candidatus Gastranaerophilales bacterium]